MKVVRENTMGVEVVTESIEPKEVDMVVSKEMSLLLSFMPLDQIYTDKTLPAT